jgi:antitoxin HicB
MMDTLRITLTPDDNGTFLVECPALPEVTTFGETEDECARQGRAAIEEAIGARMARSADVPVVDGEKVDTGAARVLFVRLPLMTILKVELYQALQATDITRAELARRLGWNRTSVDRLFMLDHASRLDQIEAAAEAMGREVHAEMVEAA